MIHFLGVLEIDGEYIFITTDIQNNPIRQFKRFQRITFFLPILLGTVFIVFAVAMVVRPIKKISGASKEVAGGILMFKLMSKEMMKFLIYQETLTLW